MSDVLFLENQSGPLLIIDPDPRKKIPSEMFSGVPENINLNPFALSRGEFLMLDLRALLEQMNATRFVYIDSWSDLRGVQRLLLSYLTEHVICSEFPGSGKSFLNQMLVSQQIGGGSKKAPNISCLSQTPIAKALAMLGQSAAGEDGFNA